ncbi:hypothetical protein QYF36_025753 [Acer negundo]|nr:hypothetical protein QYF36_025753 [Acer negundo]
MKVELRKTWQRLQLGGSRGEVLFIAGLLHLPLVHIQALIYLKKHSVLFFIAFTNFIPKLLEFLQQRTAGGVFDGDGHGSGIGLLLWVMVVVLLAAPL